MMMVESVDSLKDLNTELELLDENKSLYSKKTQKYKTKSVFKSRL